jgi:hypothetical protein
MADYTASALVKAQAKLSAKFNDPELRRKQNPALALALKNTEISIPGQQLLRTKDSRPVSVYSKNKRAASSATAKTHNHTGTKADSTETTLSWIQIVEKFDINLKQALSNIFSYEEMLQHELMETAKNIHSRAGTLALAYLQNYRTQLTSLTTGGAGSWNATTFALEISADKKNNFYQNASSFMRKQNYTGMLDVLADSTAFRQYQSIASQGSNNGVNLAWQLANMNVAETTEDIDANYTEGAILIMPEASFAGLPWNDPINLKGKGDYDSVLGGYGVISDPLGTGLSFDFHAYTERADGSSSGGGVQDEILRAEVTLNIGWALPPLSNANESVVFELAQLV